MGVMLVGTLVACSAGKTSASANEEPTLTKDVPAAVGSPAPDAAHTRAPADGAHRRLLFLGTSLTAGLGLDPDSAYPQRIQRRIDAAGLGYQVENAGVSGETSAGLYRRLDWVLRQPAQVIVVETGANDGLRGQSVEATKATIGRILDRIRQDQPEARRVLVQMEAPTNFGITYTSAFHRMFPALAKEKGVTLLPFLLDGVAGRPLLNQADGMHPNDAGEQIVTENVWHGLEPMLRRQ